MKVALILLVTFVCVISALPLQEEANESNEAQIFSDWEDDFGTELEGPHKPHKPHRPHRPHRPHKFRAPAHVHHNAFKSQGPWSGRLNNVVVNKHGKQDTRQRNHIVFHIRSKAHLRHGSEHKQNENVEENDDIQYIDDIEQNNENEQYNNEE